MISFCTRLLFVLIATLACLFVSINASAQETKTVVVEKKTIVTPPPKAGTCTTLAAHWEGDVWVDSQTVCTYEHRSEGVAWIQNYWACTAYDSVSGNCTNWQYMPGHWVKTLPQ